MDTTNSSVSLRTKRGILILSSYPPRECGIASFTLDLVKSLNSKFDNSYSVKICALETEGSKYIYPPEVVYSLNTLIESEYEKMVFNINTDSSIQMVLIQHEFGFFNIQKLAFNRFITEIKKPVIVAFHTVLPHPDSKLELHIQRIATFCKSIIVMTHNSANILTNDYGIPKQKISVIAHGTHLVLHLNKEGLKEKYKLKDRKVLSTFGLLSSGKGITTTLEALPAIIKQCPEVIFLIIGKTHPEVVKTEGEKYRELLHQVVKQLELEKHVLFINKYLPLSELLEYLQLTDIYLFTANDPLQAVSGTFAYAMSCACPIISTPIPHAKEVLTNDVGIIFDFNNSLQLSEATTLLLNDNELRKNMSINALQKIASTAWENSAIGHIMLFNRILKDNSSLKFNKPALKLDHLQKMTTNIGIVQFSKTNQPDIKTGYTLDDNARAMIAMCMYYKATGDKNCIEYIWKYLSFVKHCQQAQGNFLNYTDQKNNFTSQNNDVNLDDSNGRAIWSLGYLLSLKDLLPNEIILEGHKLIEKSLLCIEHIHSTRAMAFSIKGLFYYNKNTKSLENTALTKKLANRLVQMYKHESEKGWEWFESYLTYANSVLPEALLYAWLLTGDSTYKEIAIKSFDFLLSKIFNENGIEVISNRQWLQKEEELGSFGEQPIDVAYTIMTLSKFYDVFGNEDYKQKMKKAFNWFLGDNRLNQTIYNPCTGGCYDGVEENNVNLNQGAESTVSYLMARLTIEKYESLDISIKAELKKQIMIKRNQWELIYSTNPKTHANKVFPASDQLGLQ